MSKAGDQLRIAVQLIDVATQRHLWSENYNTELNDLFKMRSEVAQRVAEALKVTLLGSEVQRLKKEPTANMEAHRLYVLGRFFWNKRTVADFNKAIEHFNQAIARDPNYAEAYTGLALCYAVFAEYTGIPQQETRPKAQAAANKALELDPNLGEAHTALAYTKRFLYDWEGEEKGYRLAIRLNPNSATPHQWLGEQFMFLGRNDEALVEIRRAGELDPLSPIIKAMETWSLMNKGRIEDAIRLCRKELELYPDFPRLHLALGDCYVNKHLFAEALVAYRRARALDSSGPNGLYGIGHALGRAGDKAGAMQVLNELQDLRKKGLAVWPDIATVYWGLGDLEKTLDSFEQALAAGEFFGWMNSIFTDTRELRLRPHPRFQALLRKMNLTP